MYTQSLPRQAFTGHVQLWHSIFEMPTGWRVYYCLPTLSDHSSSGFTLKDRKTKDPLRYALLEQGVILLTTLGDGSCTRVKAGRLRTDRRSTA